MHDRYDTPTILHIKQLIVENEAKIAELKKQLNELQDKLIYHEDRVDEAIAKEYFIESEYWGEDE
jgi:uncharacterized coiled-coil protein SlyX